MQKPVEQLIHAENLVYRYPFTEKRSLDGVSFSLNRGEVLLVTGPSGCGKSTLLRVLNGLIPDHYKGTLEGSIAVNGTVGTVLQNPEEQILATTVEEEVALALEWQSVPSEEIRKKVDWVLNIFSLSHLATRNVFNLSSGERQKVVLASVIAAGREIIVMDEPTANLSPEATLELAEICQTLKERGKTVVIVDHRLYWLRGVLDRLLVLQEGKVVFSAKKDSGEDLLDRLAREGDLNAWGLRQVEVHPPKLLPVDTLSAPAALDVRQLDFRYGRTLPYIYRDFSVQIPKGTVTAIVGKNGVGKTTFARLISGLLKPAGGECRSATSELRTPRTLRKTTAFAMQQMDIQLYMRTVEEELLFSAPKGTPREERLREARRLLERFALSHLAARHPQSLSGGEKQRLVIAGTLMKRPEVLILDEPTSGLDGRNMRIIAEEVAAYARSGGAPVVITHDLELLALIAECAIEVESVKEG